MREELSRDLLKLIDRLEYLPSIRSLKHLSGRHVSPLKGYSPEFKEFRNYAPGEDYRRIDWKASARQSQLLVQVKDHQGMHEHWICPDLSSSMRFPEQGNSKFKSQLLYSGALMYLLHAQGDKVGLALNKAGKAELMEPMRTNEGLQQMISILADPSCLPGANVEVPLKLLLRNLQRPSVLWVMTDFDGEPDALIQTLQEASIQGHDINLIHWMHPDERNLPYQGEVEFLDLEERIEALKLFPEDLVEAYQKTYRDHLDSIREQTRRIANLSYHFIDISEPIESWLVQTLRART